MFLEKGEKKINKAKAKKVGCWSINLKNIIIEFTTHCVSVALVCIIFSAKPMNLF